MDIDTAPVALHDSRPPMQLDIPPADEVMVEADPDTSAPSAPSTPNQDGYHSTQPCNSLPHALFSSWFQSQIPSRSLDCPSSPLRLVPTPPAAAITSSDVMSWPKLKLDQLFVEWFARPESRAWLSTLLEDSNAVKPSDISHIDPPPPSSRLDHTLSPGRSRSPTAVPSNTVSPQQAPGSPVSRLFRTHEPFGDSDSSPRSPPTAPSAVVPPLKTGVAAQTMSAMDLGSSGTVSPLQSDRTSPADLSTPVPRTTSESPSPNHSDSVSKRALPDSANCTNTRKCPTATPNSSNHVDSEASNSSEGKLADVTAFATLSSPQSEEKADSAGPRLSDNSFVHVGGNGVATERTVQRNLNNDDTSDGHSRMDVVSSDRFSKGSVPLRASTELSDVEKLEVVTSSAGGDSISSHSDVINSSPRRVSGDRSPVDATQSNSSRDQTDLATNTLQCDSETTTRAAGKALESLPPVIPHTSAMEDSSVPKRVSRSRPKSLPDFYFPCGRDAELREKKERDAMQEIFKVQRTQKEQPGVSRTDIAELVVEVVGLPSFFASIVYTLVMEQFPLGSTDASTSAYVESVDNRARRSGEDTMKDMSGGGERSSSSSVSGMDRSMGIEEEWRTNDDTTMGDVNEVGSAPDRANGVSAIGNLGRAATEGDASPMVEGANELVTEEQMAAFYSARCAGYSREARLFNALLGGNSGRDYLVPSDFKPVMRALLMCHRGLAFLHATPEFQQRYSETVIERIYFGCTRQHNGRLTLADVRRSKLLDTLMAVDEEEDINRERRYFSYEHFYVLYCRFWELDANHDLQIDKEDLMRYGSHSLTTRIVERIFSGHARPLDAPQNGGYMSYTDFIWFCLSEEDKTSDTAIDYWFRCVDMDGDGLITMYDMEYFYTEQLHRMESFGHEPVQIKDILCQLLDMINPNMRPPVIRRRDLKRCRLAGNFFNVLFNLNKFFAIEARDPLQIRQEHATPELTDWDRFAALEYLRLSADEEGEEDESWEDVGEAANPLMAGEAPF